MPLGDRRTLKQWGFNAARTLGTRGYPIWGHLWVLRRLSKSISPWTHYWAPCGPPLGVPLAAWLLDTLFRGHSPASSSRRLKVERLTFNALAVAFNPCPCSNMARAGRKSNSTRGRPQLTPFACARRTPAITRSRIRLRSYSQKAPIRWSINRPDAEVVSIPESRRETNSTR